MTRSFLDLPHRIVIGLLVSACAALGTTTVADESWQKVLEVRRSWWSLQPVQSPEIPPAIQGTSSDQPIDRFVSSRLDQAGLNRSASADGRTLIRRLNLVLVGLPPTPSQVDQFVDDYAHDPRQAYARAVDRLLSSPRFGERWARHWMDVVRFSETHGYEWNHEIRDAWQYRDYVIRAFNADLPYDQFIREQIAGDLLKPPRTNGQLGINESIIGTAFWRFSELAHDNCVIFPELRYDALDNQIDTLTKAFQATTVSCARCHDHKIDAVSTIDYYALIGILESSRQVIHTLDLPDVFTTKQDKLRELKSEIRQQLANLWVEATGQVAQSIEKALQSDASETDEVSHFVQALREQLQQEDLGLEHVALPLQRIAQLESEVSVADAWQGLVDEYNQEQQTRASFNSENFEPWVAFNHDPVEGWRTTGLGADPRPCQSGELVMALEGDQMVRPLLPAGLYTHLLSDRLNGTMHSPWIPTRTKNVSIQILGGGLSMVRAVIDSCSLNEYVGGGLEYLDQAPLQWKQFPTSAGGPHRSYIELTTKSDNLRWPDRPGRAGKDEAKLDSPRSWFGIARAVFHDCDESPRAELTHLQALFLRSQSEDIGEIADVIAAYQSTCRDAVQAWCDGRATDTDVVWINWLISGGLLPNSIDASQSLAELVREYRAVESSLPTPRVVAGMADHGAGFESPLLKGGSATDLGPLVPRRFLEVVAGKSAIETAGSGRREMAEFIADKDNPLTARVMVNRVWHHLFGSGIVVTTDDFGHLGEMPTHPQLLDYLSREFVERGWSIKKLIREIVTSRTFQQSSVPSAEAIEQDPLNRLLHHYPVRRLDGEAIRDTFLAVSGRLDSRLFGSSIHPYRTEPKPHRKLDAGPLDGNGRRSLYLKITRMEGAQFLELFDLPIPMSTRGRRDSTNLPAQALALLNDPFLVDQSRFWSVQLVARHDDSAAQRIDYMFTKALGRPPADRERSRMTNLVERLQKIHDIPSDEILTSSVVWQDVSHTLLNLKELIYVR